MPFTTPFSFQLVFFWFFKASSTRLEDSASNLFFTKVPAPLFHHFPPFPSNPFRFLFQLAPSLGILLPPFVTHFIPLGFFYDYCYILVSFGLFAIPFCVSAILLFPHGSFSFALGFSPTSSLLGRIPPLLPPRRRLVAFQVLSPSAPSSLPYFLIRPFPPLFFFCEGLERWLSAFSFLKSFGCLPFSFDSFVWSHLLFSSHLPCLTLIVLLFCYSLSRSLFQAELLSFSLPNTFFAMPKSFYLRNGGLCCMDAHSSFFPPPLFFLFLFKDPDPIQFFPKLSGRPPPPKLRRLTIIKWVNLFFFSSSRYSSPPPHPHSPSSFPLFFSLFLFLEIISSIDVS